MDSRHSESLHEEIRQRAHELYNARGREDGHAEEDWLLAEAEVMARYRSQEQAEAA